MFHTRNNKKKSAIMGVRLHLLKPLPNLPINSRPSPLLNKKITILLLFFLKRKQWTAFTLICSQLPINSRQPLIFFSRKALALFLWNNPFTMLFLSFFHQQWPTFSLFSPSPVAHPLLEHIMAFYSHKSESFHVANSRIRIEQGVKMTRV